MHISVSQLRAGSLLKLADMSKNIAAKQQMVLKEIESYLGKYGYKTMDNPKGILFSQRLINDYVVINIHVVFQFHTSLPCLIQI